MFYAQALLDGQRYSAYVSDHLGQNVTDSEREKVRKAMETKRQPNVPWRIDAAACLNYIDRVIQEHARLARNPT
jgi:hypothetical protein